MVRNIIMRDNCYTIIWHLSALLSRRKTNWDMMSLLNWTAKSVKINVLMCQNHHNKAKVKAKLTKNLPTKNVSTFSSITNQNSHKTLVENRQKSLLLQNDSKRFKMTQGSFFWKNFFLQLAFKKCNFWCIKVLIRIKNDLENWQITTMKLLLRTLNHANSGSEL